MLDCNRTTEPSLHAAIYWDSTSTRVLCMEWIDGVKLTDQPAMAQ